MDLSLVDMHLDLRKSHTSHAACEGAEGAHVHKSQLCD